MGDGAIIEISVLGSGSYGNAVFIRGGGVKLLLDAGLSGREVVARLRQLGVQAAELTAIVVTHEHLDHVRGVGVLSRRFEIPVYVNEGTYRAAKGTIGEVAGPVFFETGGPFEIGSLALEPFMLPHDAEDPVGFTVTDGESLVGIVTDLGYPTHLAREKVKAADLLVLEANHDLGMLNIGPYPWEVKQRIRGRLGHLSNDDSCGFLKSVLNDGLRHVILAHLSRTNNHPLLVRSAAEVVLGDSEVALHMASQDHATPPILV